MRKLNEKSFKLILIKWKLTILQYDGRRLCVNFFYYYYYSVCHPNSKTIKTITYEQCN